MRRLCLLPAIAILFCEVGAAQLNRFEYADKPRLVDCKDQPCFRLVLNAVNVLGQPTAFPLTARQAVERLKVAEPAGLEHPVFHVRLLEQEGRSDGRGNYSLLLLDVSGSMNGRLPGSGETKFQAARRAVLEYLADFREGVDRIAIVPFESRRVVEQIRRAAFHESAEGARRQLNALPDPHSRGNTALFTSVYEALSILRFYKDAGYQVSLVALTDGRNDVRPPPVDDPGLMGSSGLEEVTRRAQEFGIQVITIGFGARGGALDEETLQRLAWPTSANYYYAGDAERLAEVFGAARRKLTNRIELTFGPVRDDKSRLSGQTLHFQVSMDQGGAPISTPEPISWISPAIGSPSYEDSLSPDELGGLIESQSLGRDSPLLRRTLWRLLILLIFGISLALLWFVLPRWIWPERYIALPPGLVPGPQPRNPAGAAAHRSPGPAPGTARQPAYRDSRVTIAPAPGASPPVRPRQSPERRDGRGEETVFLPPDQRKPRGDN